MTSVTVAAAKQMAGSAATPVADGLMAFRQKGIADPLDGAGPACMFGAGDKGYIFGYITPMEVRVKISLVDDDGNPFMGPGVLRLLEQVALQGSINRAAKQMRLSYPKALKMVNRLEKSLGRRVLLRSRGGPRGGGARLSAWTRQFLHQYRELESAIKGDARRELDLFLSRLPRDDLEGSSPADQESTPQHPES